MLDRRLRSPETKCSAPGVSNGAEAGPPGSAQSGVCWTAEDRQLKPRVLQRFAAALLLPAMSSAAVLLGKCSGGFSKSDAALV